MIVCRVDEELLAVAGRRIVIAEVASVESFEPLFEMSPRFKANLDIGHFVAGNNDPIDFIRKGSSSNRS